MCDDMISSGCAKPKIKINTVNCLKNTRHHMQQSPIIITGYILWEVITQKL